MDYGMEEVVTLHLDAADGRADASVVPKSVTIAGISEVLEFEERGLAGRVSLLSTLDDLKREGLIEEREKEVEELAGKRAAYFPTETGRNYAQRLREEVTDEVVRVRDGGETELSLGDIDGYLPPPALPRALARMTDDGIVYLDDPGEGFVNRTAELDAFETTLEEAAGGTPASILVSGQAGIGKTTLVADEVADRARAAGFRVAVGGCRADAPEPYAPFREVLDGIEGTSRALDPGESGATPSDARRYDAQRKSMFDGIVEAFSTAASVDPLLVVVEDLHLAGEPTVALFGHLVEHLAAPVVLVGTYRPEDLSDDHPLRDLLAEWGDDRDPGTAGGTDRGHLSLEPFGPDQTRRLVEWIVERPDVPGEFADLVYDRTGGHPLFVEEVVTHAIGSGVVDPRHDVFPTDPDQLPVPDTVEETIDLRLAVLDEDTSSVLDVAALVGQRVPRDVLDEAVALQGSDLRSHVDLLVDARVFERAGEGTLRFVSGVVREASADRIPEGRRRELHGRIADAYAAVREDDPDRHAAVAHHRAAAGNREAAFEAYRKAGERAIDVYAADAATDAYESAFWIATDELDRPDDDEEVLEVLENLATAHRLLDDYDAADRHLQYVAERTDDADRRRTVAGRRAAMWRERGHYRKAMEVIEAAIDEVGIDDTEASARLLSMKGYVHGKREEYDLAERTHDRAIAVAEATDGDDEEFVTLLERQKESVDLDRGTVDESTIEREEAVLEEAREDGDEHAVAVALLNLGLAYQEYGDLDRALETLEESIDSFDELGMENSRCDARNTMAVALERAGEWGRAREEFETALDTARRVDNERILTYTHTNLGELHAARGRLETALEHVQRGLELADELGNPHYWTGLAISRSGLAVERDDTEEAVEWAERSLETADDVGIGSMRLAALHQLGEAHRARGDLEEAVEYYEDGLEAVAGTAGVEPDVESALHHGLARALLERGDVDEAHHHAVDAGSVGADAAFDDAGIRATTVRGACHRERGEFEEAEAVLESAVETAAETGWRLLEWRATCELGVLDRARGDDREATERLSTVADRASEHGAKRIERRSRDVIEGDRETD